MDGLVLGVQALVGTQPGPELGDLGQAGVVGGAQLGRVGHGVEVADGTPGHAQFFGGHIQFGGNALPGGGKVRGRHGAQGAFGLQQQDVQRRLDVVGLDLVEQREWWWGCSS